MPNPPGLAPLAVSHVSITVSDMERSLGFYRDVLGFEVLFDDELGGPELEAIVGVPGATGRAVGIALGGVRIELLEESWIPEQPRSPGLGLNALTLQVADAEAAWQRARELGYEPMTKPIELLGTRLFFIADPDGQGVELVEYIPGGGAWGGTY